MELAGVDEAGVFGVVVGGLAVFPGFGLCDPAVDCDFSEFWCGWFCHEEDEVWDGVLVSAYGC